MPVSLPFLRSFQCAIPTNISDKEKEGRCTKQFQCLVHYLSDNSIIITGVSDKAFLESSVLISTREKIGQCSKFDRMNECIDNFYFKRFDMNDTYQNLAIVLQLIFVLSHGQASVERDFSLNKGVLNDNMKELSIIPQRAVKDHLRILKVGASEVTIMPSFIISVALSHSRYSTFLLKQKEKSLNETKQILDNEIRECEQKKYNVKQLVDSLNKEFIENSLKAADGSDANKMMELLVKGREIGGKQKKAKRRLLNWKVQLLP